MCPPQFPLLFQPSTLKLSYTKLWALFEGIENNLIRELIISDGGSTDKTKLIADELGAVVVEGSCEVCR